MTDLPRSTAIARWSCPRTAAVPGAGDTLFRIGLALEGRDGLVPSSHKTLRGIGDLELRRRTPQAFQVVIPPRVLAEDVHNKTAEIQQCPIRRTVAFAVPHRPAHLFVELLFDFCADGLHLRRAEARANHEIVRERARAAQI